MFFFENNLYFCGIKQNNLINFDFYYFTILQFYKYPHTQ